ncbi:MAG TPA: hypothetical protein VKQ08_07140, partial [Cyclobacteriaceae bacterium]|nr:hypothetical protein [Cyclobacteriaceae bacterium]
LIDNWHLVYDKVSCIRIFYYAMPVLIYHFLYLLKDKRYFAVIRRFEFLFYGLMMFLILTNSGFSGEFIYFQF